MKCNRIKYLLNGYLEDKLTKKERLILEEHLSTCKKCKEEITGMVDVHLALSEMFEEKELDEQVLRDHIMIEIHDVDYKKSVRRNLVMYRKKIITALGAFIIMIGCTLIPIKGQTLASTVLEWFDQLTVETETSTIKCINEDIDMTDEEYAQLKEDAKTYKPGDLSLENMKENMGLLYVRPENIPERYAFSAGEYKLFDGFNNSTHAFCRFLYKSDMDSDYAGQDWFEVSLHINTDLEGMAISNQEITIQAEGLTSRKVDFLGGNAVIAQLGGMKELICPNLYIDDNNEIGISVAIRNSSSQAYEEELKKVAESIINQYKQNEAKIGEYFNKLERELQEKEDIDGMGLR